MLVEPVRDDVRILHALSAAESLVDSLMDKLFGAMPETTSQARPVGPVLIDVRERLLEINRKLEGINDHISATI